MNIKRIISAGLSLALSFSTIFFPSAFSPNSRFFSYNVSAAEARGSFGSGLEWSFDIDSGCLMINGEGAMPMYEWQDETPWYSRSDRITSIVIEEGITNIPQRAFCDYQFLENVSIPSSVDTIGRDAFQNTPWLEGLTKESPIASVNGIVIDGYKCSGKVTLPNGTRSIAEAAFEGSRISSIVLPDTITYIADYAFDRCHSLESITIPNSVTYIGKYAFDETPWLEREREGSPLVIAGDGILIDGRECEGEITLPGNTKVIGKKAFYNCTAITGINFNEGLKEIWDNAFEECDSITEITLSNTVESIGNNAFEMCFDMASFTAGDNLRYIGSDAFINCMDLVKADLGHIVFLGENVFNGCIDLAFIHFTDDLIHIGRNAFAQTPWLYDRFSEGSPVIVGSLLIDGTGCSGDITIPSNVSVICSYAFAGSYIKSVVVPENTKLIGTNAFIDCYSLKSITIRNPLCGIGTDPSPDTLPEKCVIYGLKESTAQRYAENFNRKFSVIGEKETTAATTTTLTTTKTTATTTTKNTAITTTKNTETTAAKNSTTANITSVYTTKASTVTTPKITFLTSKRTTAVTTHLTGYYTRRTYPAATSTIATTFVPASSLRFTTVTTWNTTRYTTSSAKITTRHTTTVSKVTYISSFITTSITSPIYTPFQWGRDNWDFTNSSTFFTHNNYHISDDLLSLLRSNMTNTEYNEALQLKNEEWGGSCYGMSALAVLAKAGYLPYSSYTYGADCLHQMDSPDKNERVESLINYYFLLQMKKCIQQEFLKGLMSSREEMIKSIIEQLKTSPEIIICYQQENWGGHAVTATGVTYGNWSILGANYQGRIEILDPNRSMNYDQNVCIYFNTSTYHWIIPAYAVISNYGGVISMASSDIGLINSGGFLEGTPGYNYDETDHIYNLELTDIAPVHNISKIRKVGKNYVMSNSENDDIFPYTLFPTGASTANEKQGYILKDEKSGYRISQSSPHSISAVMHYNDRTITAECENATQVTFHPSGYVSTGNDSNDCKFTMVTNEEYCPNDWYTIEVSGKNSMTLEANNEGYVVSGSKLNNVILTLSDDEEKTRYRFSAGNSSVLISETAEGSVKLSADMDHNGTFETPVSAGEVTETEWGDANEDGVLNVRDAAYIARMLAYGLVEKLPATADANLDSKINVRDAAWIAFTLSVAFKSVYY